MTTGKSQFLTCRLYTISFVCQYTQLSAQCCRKTEGKKPTLFVGSEENASECRWDLRGIEGTKDSDKCKSEGILGTRNEVGPNAIQGLAPELFK